MKYIKNILPHVVIILSLMMLTFYFIDLVNPYMQFIDHPITKTLLCIFGFTSAATAILYIAKLREE